jgi:hypothetical protein
MVSVLTFLIGLAWIVWMIGIPVAFWVWLTRVDPSPNLGLIILVAGSVPWVGLGFVWVCLRVGMTIKPWLAEVLR